MTLYDAVPVPSMGPSEALRLLRERFPSLAPTFGNPDDPEPGEPYNSYELFADEVLRRRSDNTFLSTVYEFVSEMAASGDYTLEDLLIVTVLESLAQDREFASTLYPNINKKAQEALRAVERQTYGRP